MQVLGSNMEINLCWHQKRTNNKWTDDLTDHLMVDLEVIIALASMIYIVDLGGFTPSYYFAYTCVRDLFIGGITYLAEKIIR